uniref:Tyrosine-protein kinase ephrin type A/B receptor-like domain-containing protein n=1 Tax=Mantoniella antarctica TaxID=81844 RepID=A0A7S0X8I7_9CHLO|mmetsp:Transcript_26656/g.66766  ORF Transcript_26656/g.66766 Transcript_26656/m.66766 type:complete len:1689 (+) Transcript_26656:660-5726(+)
MQSIRIAVDEDTNVTAPFIGTDPEGDRLTYELTCNVTKGNIYISSDSQLFTYVPFEDVFGTDSFVYKALDTSGAESDLASVEITIMNQPDQPKSRNMALTLTSCTPAQLAQAQASGVTVCDDSKGYSIILEGYDPDMDFSAYTLEYTVQSEPQVGTLALTDATSVSTGSGIKRIGSNPAQFTMYTGDLIAAGGSSDGSIFYVNFTYTASNGLFDSNVATVTIAVKALLSTSETPPVGYDSTASTAENTAVSTTVNVTDADLLDVLTCMVATQPSFGVVFSASNAAEPREFTYVPVQAFHGMDSFTVTCADQSNAKATVAVAVNVSAINDAAFGAASAPSTVAQTVTTAAMTLYKAWQITLASVASFKTDEEALLAPAVATGDTAAWHLSAGDVSWADADSKQDRYLIALLGYDHESSNTPTASTTTTLTYNITSSPAFGDLYLASPAAAVTGGITYTDVERFSPALVTRGNITNTTSYTLINTIATEPSLLWYEPSQASGQTVGRSGWVEVRWTVSDGIPGSDGLTPDPTGAAAPVSREYTSRVYVTCVPGYKTVSDNILNGETPSGDPRSATSLASCVACEAGTFGVDAGATSCAACPPGTYTNSSAAMTCTDCSQGTYAAMSGMSVCTPCPTEDLALMSSTKRSTSEAQCICQPGTWRQEISMTAVNILNNSNAGVTCRTCPDLTKCDELNQVIPKIGEPGFWITPTDGSMVIACTPPDSCVSWTDTAGVLSGNCSAGYAHGVPGCSECLPKHFRDNRGGYGYCTQCPQTSWWVYFIGTCLFVAVIPIIIRASQMQVGFGAVNIIVSYIQVLSMFRKLDFEWPLSVSEFFKAFAIFNLDIFTLTPPQCVVSWSYVNKLWIVSLIPILYVAVFFVICANLFLHHRLVAAFKHRLLPIFPSLHMNEHGVVLPNRPSVVETSGLPSIPEEGDTKLEKDNASALAEDGGIMKPNAPQHYAVTANSSSAVVEPSGQPNLLSGPPDLPDERGTKLKTDHSSTPAGGGIVDQNMVLQDRIQPSLELLEIIRSKMINWVGTMLLSSVTPERLFGVFIPRLMQGFLLLMLWGYFMLSSNTLEYFHCAKESGRGDKYYMVNDPAMECWNFAEPNLHTKLLPVAILSVLLYPVGIVAGLVYIIHRHRHLLRDRSRLMALHHKSASPADWLKREELMTAKRRFGFLFLRYEDDCYYWEIVVVLRKLFYIVVGTLMRSPIEQILTLIAMLVLFSAVFLNTLPFDNNVLDVMEGVSLISNLFVLFAGFLFFSEMLTPYERGACAVGVQSLLVLSCIVLGVLFVMDTVPNLRILITSYRRDIVSTRLAAMRERGEVEGRTKVSNMSAWFTATNMLSQFNRPKRLRDCLARARVVYNKDVVEQLRGYTLLELTEEEIVAMEAAVETAYLSHKRIAFGLERRGLLDGGHVKGGAVPESDGGGGDDRSQKLNVSNHASATAAFTATPTAPTSVDASSGEVDTDEDLRVVTDPEIQAVFLQTWRRNERGLWERKSRQFFEKNLDGPNPERLCTVAADGEGAVDDNVSSTVGGCRQTSAKKHTSTMGVVDHTVGMVVPSPLTTSEVEVGVFGEDTEKAESVYTRETFVGDIIHGDTQMVCAFSEWLALRASDEHKFTFSRLASHAQRWSLDRHNGMPLTHWSESAQRAAKEDPEVSGTETLSNRRFKAKNSKAEDESMADMFEPML